MDLYDEYKLKCSSIRKGNMVLLDDFASWIRAKGLTEATARKHRENIDFYINEFLLYDSATPASEGVDEVGMFLGYWFIRKAMWANEAAVKYNVTSLKKFYDYMLERGEVDREAVEDMKTRIKEELPEWLETMKRYDDPSIDPEDVWQW